jgi:hypothetical protein
MDPQQQQQQHHLGEAWLENCATAEQLRFFREEGE